MDIGPETSNVFVTQQIKRTKMICFFFSLRIYYSIKKLLVVITPEVIKIG